MLINEACRKCNLTKKAIEYYGEQMLVLPRVLENGYRDYSEDDVERLKKISVLRKLGLSVSQIKEVLFGKGSAVLSEITGKKALEIDILESKQELVRQLAQNQDWEYTRSRLEILEQRQSVLERLSDVFPGYYGQYVTWHFAGFLDEPAVTEEQQDAFETIIRFLDSVECDIPADMQEYLEEVGKDFDPGFARSLSDNLDKAFGDTKAYIADNQEALDRYMKYRQSEEYRESPAYRLQLCLKKFSDESGYNTVFIPAMKRLSKSYCDYHAAMEKANEAFLKMYPGQIGDPIT